MPVVTVVAAALGSRADERLGLAALNEAVARELGLAAADVFAVHVPAGVAVLGAEVVRPWPVVTLHGRDRGADAMAAAARAAAASVAASWDCAADDVWVQWLLR